MPALRACTTAPSSFSLGYAVLSVSSSTNKLMLLFLAPQPTCLSLQEATTGFTGGRHHGSHHSAGLPSPGVPGLVLVPNFTGYHHPGTRAEGQQGLSTSGFKVTMKHTSGCVYVGAYRAGYLNDSDSPKCREHQPGTQRGLELRTL